MFPFILGMKYSEADVLEIKYYVKKNIFQPSFDTVRATLNYIVKVKTLAQKEQWLNRFLQHVRELGYRGSVYDFPGVCKVYEGNGKHQEYYARRYTLVNVTMRDHLSPFKMSLMAVARGRIKPKRHQFRVKINRSRLFVDRMLPLKYTVRQYIEDFSDIRRLDSL